MRNRLRLPFLCGAVLVMALSGCSPAEPEKSMRALIGAMNSLADTFDTVTDANSAEAATAGVDQYYADAIAAMKGVAEHKNVKVPQALFDELKGGVDKAAARVAGQTERLKKIRGLPVKFWRVVHMRSVELLMVMADAIPNAPPEARDQIQKLKAFFDKHGYENVVEVELLNMNESLRAKALERFQQVAPGIEVFDQTDWKFVLGPVKEFPKFVAALDMGQVEFEDEAQGQIRISVDRRKLGARAANDAEERRLHDEEWRLSQERREQEREAARLQREEEEKRKRLDPNAPDYYEKLATRMVSRNHFEQVEAIDLLLQVDPAKVPSPETRAKIARGFKQLAEEGHFGEQRKAVKGLVVWGGKFSVPILVKLLDNRDPFLEREVIKALGDLKDERGAKPVAARLGDFRCHNDAVSALREMGGVAEDALIEVAPSEDPRICLAAIGVLGDVGTPKSFKVLRLGVASRNFQVREAAKNAIAKINTRKDAAEKKGN